MNLLPPTKAKYFVNAVQKMRLENSFSVEYHVSCPTHFRGMQMLCMHTYVSAVVSVGHLSPIPTSSVSACKLDSSSMLEMVANPYTFSIPSFSNGQAMSALPGHSCVPVITYLA